MPKGRYSSQKVDLTEDGAFLQADPVNDKYLTHLLLLQEKNRVKKDLRAKAKSSKVKDLEKKEHGFTLYVNGANQELPKNRLKHSLHSKKGYKSPHGKVNEERAKTAEGTQFPIVILNERDLEKAHSQHTSRAKTAPEKKKNRRNWCTASVEIKTHRGENVHVKVPNTSYEDDFEEVESSSDSDSITSSSECESDICEVIEVHEESMDKRKPTHAQGSKSQKEVARKDGRKQEDSRRKKEEEAASDEKQRVTLSVKDVQKLYQSLEMNESLRESIANYRKRQDRKTDADSPISEDEETSEAEAVSEDDSIEEGRVRVGGSQDPRRSGPKAAASHSRKVQFQPKDVIVLEFGGGKGKTVAAPNHSAKPAANSSATTEAKSVYRTSANSILKNKVPGPKKGQEDIMLKSNAPSKARRPVSASQKLGEMPVDASMDARAVLEAVRQENDKLNAAPSASVSASVSASASHRKSQSHTRDSTASTTKSWKDKLQSTTVVNSTKSPKSSKPASDEAADIEALDLLKLDGGVEDVVRKVLQLPAREQERLLKRLQKIDRSVVESSSPRKDIRVIERPAGNKSFRSSVTKSQTSPVTASVELFIEILSNWGHASRVGLTEIQVFNQRGEQVPLTSNNVMIHGAKNPQGDMTALFNGRVKTNKDKQMFSCDLPTDHLDIIIIAHNMDKAKDFCLSKLVLWNYNRLSDLDMGVREVCVRVDGKVQYSGEVEKGCGNQVFDYGHHISLLDDDAGAMLSPSNRSKPESPRKKSAVKEATVVINTKAVPDVNGADPKTVTPTIDRVALFGNEEDDDSRMFTPRSGRQEKNGDRKERNGEFKMYPAVESTNEPRQRHRLRKESQMAARCDDSSSVDSSASASITCSTSVERSRHRSRSRNREAEPTTPRRSLPKLQRQPSLNSKHSSPTSESPETDSSTAKPPPAEQSPVKTRTSATAITEANDKEEVRKTEASNTQSSSKSKSKDTVQSDKKSGHDLSRGSDSVKKKPLGRKGSLRLKKNSGAAGGSSDKSQDDIKVADGRTYVVNTAVPKSEKVKSKDVDKTPKPDSYTSKKDEGLMDKLRHAQSGAKEKSEWLEEMSANSKTKKNENRKMPLWLEKEGVAADIPWESPPVSSRSARAAKGDSILKEFQKVPSEKESSSKGPSSKADPISDIFSDKTQEPAEAKSGDPIKSVLADSEEGVDDVDSLIQSEMTRMHRIVSARSENRTKQPNVPHQPTARPSSMQAGSLADQQRMKGGRNDQQTLEESWTSLNLFARSQRGRLSVEIGMGEDLDDCLDAIGSSRGKKGGVEPTIQEEEAALVEEELAQLESELSAYAEPAEPEDQVFIIPELPEGSQLLINILTTWGDRHYVGLNGIEVFTASGQQAVVSGIRAEPADINVLPEYTKDPRVVTNIVDGINRTRDDTHMWLAPYTQTGKHLVHVTFQDKIKVAMMRIWNYNKSRIHSYRGARDIEIHLDDVLIFKGEITRACGEIIGSSDAFGDTILFTTDEEILEQVSQHDQVFEADWLLEEEEVKAEEEQEEERPQTADRGDQPGQVLARPFTAAAGQSSAGSELATASLLILAEGETVSGQCVKLNFTSTWGDPHYLGLTGLQLLGAKGETISLDMSMLEADPRDLQILPGYEKDDRTLDKLIDGKNVTCSDEHMWLIPFTEGENHVLTISLPLAIPLLGLRIWNYNKSPECTYRGARCVHVYIDNQQVSPATDGFLVRKGPGNCYFDFAQEILFHRTRPPQGSQAEVEDHSRSSSSTDEASQEYEVVEPPCGFIYQLQLLSTWGDQYYVGLTGLQLFDSRGTKIPLTSTNITAYPDSVNVLPSIKNDVRTPDKLIDDVNDVQDGSHAWLAPVLPGFVNRIYIIFDYPVELSIVKLWNYGKSPNRGVKDFALLVDDLLVYNGQLEMVKAGAKGIIPSAQAPLPYHTILFTNKRDIIAREKHTLIRNKASEQEVALMNDKQLVSDPTAGKRSKPVDQALRPTTSVTRPTKKR